MIQHHARTAPLARWDARLRLLALLLLAFACSAVHQVQAVPCMLAVAALAWWLSGVSLRYLLQRLRYPSLLVAGMTLALLLAGGKTVWWRWGWVSISREGAQAAVLLVARFYSILTLAIAFLAGAPLLATIAALRALGVPYLMADMALLMVRYLEVLKTDLHHMRMAMRLRGFRPQGWSWRTITTQAWLAAHLLLRSHERAEGVYHAMRLRGYGCQAAPRPTPLTPTDWAYFAGAVAVAIGLFWWG